jgi:hypothetical protein
MDAARAQLEMIARYEVVRARFAFVLHGVQLGSEASKYARTCCSEKVSKRRRSPKGVVVKFGR